MDNSEDFIERDEVIADSEEEMEGLGSSSAAGRGSALSMPPPRQLPEISSIAAFSSVKGGHDSSISAFTGGLDFSAKFDDRSFGKDADTSGYSNVFNDTLTGTFSIADRAKTRKRKPTDVLELTSDEEDELSLKPTTSKSKFKSMAKAKSPQKPPNPKADQPSSSTNGPQRASDSPNPKPRPRPRPRPIAKKSKTENPVHLDATKDLDHHSMPLGGPELPIATSPIRSHPPADLPPSSISTGLPHIETTGSIDDLFDGPLSSPGSLFSDEDKTSKRKKGPRHRAYPSDVEMEVDALASPPRLLSYDRYEDPVTGPPPPTFFAGSSQPEETAGPALADPQSKASTSSNAATSDPDVIDLTDLPATLAPAIIVKKHAKPKKPRKKRSEEDFGAWEENGAAGLYVFDDDNDEDFNPSGDGKKKAKGKAKEKGKGKEKPVKTSKAKGKGKQKNLDITSDDVAAQVSENLNPEDDTDLSLAQPQSGIPEVIITTKPARKSRKTKDKNKGASDVPSTSSNKEVFKSCEFIDDSGDDAPPPAPHTTNEGAQGPSEPDAFETPEDAPIFDMASSSKQTSSGRKQKSTVVQSEAEEEELALRPATTKKGKKKVVIDLDESAEEWEKQDNGGISQTDESIRPSEPKNKGKEGKKKGRTSKKAKQTDTVMNDMGDDDETAITKIRESLALEQAPKEPPAEEENEEEVIATKPHKRASRKVVDDDDDMLEEGERRGKESAGAGSSFKENLAPKPASNLITPNNRSNASGSSSKPAPGSLYARYEIAPRTRGPSMSELIRRANSHPSSPFANATPSDADKTSGKVKSRPSLTPSSRVYSPYLKSSRSLLNKIAPLHPNRRTPPPPPPPLPPKKKTKKELEREEKWEEELVESIGGLEAWAALGDDERKNMRRAKFAMEMGGWDD